MIQWCNEIIKRVWVWEMLVFVMFVRMNFDCIEFRMCGKRWTECENEVSNIFMYEGNHWIEWAFQFMVTSSLCASGLNMMYQIWTSSSWLVILSEWILKVFPYWHFVSWFHTNGNGTFAMWSEIWTFELFD